MCDCEVSKGIIAIELSEGVCIARAIAARCAVHSKCSGQETSESHKACVAILHNHIHRWAITRSSSRISWQPKRTLVMNR